MFDDTASNPLQIPTPDAGWRRPVVVFRSRGCAPINAGNVPSLFSAPAVVFRSMPATFRRCFPLARVNARATLDPGDRITKACTGAGLARLHKWLGFLSPPGDANRYPTEIMTDFARNRYDASEFADGFAASEVVRDGDELCVSFPTSHAQTDEMTIWFPSCGDVPSAPVIELARQMCASITLLDNMVQDSCESEWKRNGHGPENYDLFIAYAEINHDNVGIEYFGAKVNTQWNAKFKQSPDGGWSRVNF